MKKTTWNHISAGLGRNDFPSVLAQAVLDHSLEPGELAIAIERTWVVAEWPSRQIDPESWSTIFSMVVDHGEFLADDGVVRKSSELPKTLTLYRGALPEFAFGMSWTDKLSIAEWFAHRFDSPQRELAGQIYSIAIPREYVIGQFNGRKESEYVVDITYLSEDDEVQIVDRA